MSKILYSVSGQVAIVTLNNPPLNTFDCELRRDVVLAIDKAEMDSNIKAIVLIGSERAFSGGADLNELLNRKIYEQPNFPVFADILESCSKPTIAAIGGVAFGGGLEPALGCHYRVALADAKVGQLEVTMGIMPAGGGSQRLPRLIGIEKALNMIVSGKPVSAKQLKGSGLFDEIFESDLLGGAIAFAEKIIAKGCPIKKSRDIKINDPYAEAYLQFAKQIVASSVKNNGGPLKSIESIENCINKSFDEGMKSEFIEGDVLLNTPESKSLMHLFLAEKAVSKIPDVPDDTPTRKVERVAIVGSGVMACGISIVFLNAGIPVTLLARSQQSLDKSQSILLKNYTASVQKGKMTQEQLEKTMSLLKATLSYEDLKDADLIIEAVAEEFEIKEEVFTKLDAVAKPGAILATNTSSLDVNKIANFTKRPEDVIGMHFFSPANIMKLLEVVRGDKTAKDVIATVMDVCKKVKKIGVLAGVCDGFIGNRMLYYYLAAAHFLVEQGASPQQVDAALEKWGMAMGPFKMQDAIGQDILGLIRKRRYAENTKTKVEMIGDELFKMGRFGQKTEAGWYRYEAGTRGGLVDPIVEKMIVDVRLKLGVKPRKISDQEIIERCVYMLINEGAKLLAEGIALRASDVDVIYAYGYGFPSFRGGPMLYADTVSPYKVARSLKRFSQEPGADPSFWEPATMLVELADTDKTFN